MRVCVVGTGPSGLTTIKQLLDEGHDVTCFEKSSGEGGIWYRHDGDGDEMKVYDNLVLTISSKLMAFSDFIPKGERVFYTHQQYLKYLQDYATKYGLRKHIRFDSEVTQIRKSGGGYVVSVRSDGKTTEHTFEAVSICTGPFSKPNDRVQDLEKFTGEVVHSSRYRNAARFRDKRVLVIGLAESGADIVRDVSDVAAACTLVIRSYPLLLPRLGEGQHPTDAYTQRAHHYEVGVRASAVRHPVPAIFGDNRAARALWLTCAATYGLGSAIAQKVSKTLSKPEELPEKNLLGVPMFPLKIDTDVEWTQENMDAMDEWNRRSHDNEGNWSPSTIFCKNVRFLPNVVNGKVQMNDTGVARIEGKRVTFNDGATAEFDTIILCTGFIQDLSVFGDDVKVKDDNVRNLYKHAFDPDHDGRLAWIGFVRPYAGGIPICAEMQARYFALLLSGKLRLPSDVRERIRVEKEWEEAQTTRCLRHTTTVTSQVFFCDAIAKEIGCLLPMSELVKHPKLFLRHWFYSFNQACYRLVGPHAMPEEAMEELMSGGPGPLGQSVPIMAFTMLTVLPRNAHPKNLEFGTGALGMPRPPKGPYFGKDHFLIRDANKRPRPATAAQPPPKASSHANGRSATDDQRVA